MAHTFLKKMMEAEAGRFQLQVFSCLLGGALLINSIIAQYVLKMDSVPQVLAMCSALLLGAPLVWNAFKDLWIDSGEMNEFAALSFLAAFCTSDYNTAAAIAFFMIIAQMVEYRSQVGARKNIESLLRLSPDRAVRVNGDAEEEIDCSQLCEDDIVRVRPGDKVPGDGIVVKGQSSVNEASITGESIPAEKQAGDKVYGGTLNHSGILEIKITSVGADTTLAKIKHLILEAEESRTPVMRLIDQYAHWYTPVILTLAAIVLFFTRDINRAISMLIIACPCAVLLSSPTALVAALSASSRLGVIIKNISALETTHKVDSIIFDKTGTLTTGTLRVSKIVAFADTDENELLRLAASVEFNSRHPVALALVEESRNRKLDMLESENFEEISGLGVSSIINGNKYIVGHISWLEKNGVLPPEVDSKNQSGLSILYVVKNSSPIGWIGLEDTIRPDAVVTINKLKQNSIEKVVMLTGDRWSVAKNVANKLDCEVEAEVLPGEKMDRVVAIKEEGKNVAVVGDGVNDAPALAAGDVSIAMGVAGSDVAIHSASIVLMNEKLDRIPFVFKLSHRTLSIMKQNLFFSILYIIILLFASSVGILPPLLAVIIHTSSSLFIVCNSARLLREGEELV